MFPTLLAQHPTLAAAMETYRFDRLRRRRSSTPPPPATAAPASRGRARSTAPSRSRRRCRSTARASTSSTSPPTSRWPSGSTTWPPATAPGWPPRAGRCSPGRPPSGPRERCAAPTGATTSTTSPGLTRRTPTSATRRSPTSAPRTTLRDAIAAAQVLGLGHPAAWSQIAAGLVVPVDRQRVHPEFSGYRGQLVKQADVTLLQYPWGSRCPPAWPSTTSTTTCRAPIRSARR